MAKRKQKINPRDEGILEGLGYIQAEHGLDMDPTQLMRYLNFSQIEKATEKIYEKYKTSKDKNKILRQGIAKYIVEQKPFDERGQKILKGSLESIANKGIFSFTKRSKKRRAKEYIKTQDTTKQIAEEVSRNYKLYEKEMPGITTAVRNWQKGKVFGTIGDIFYGIGAIPERLYKEGKRKTQMYADNVLTTAKKGYEDFIKGSYEKATAGIIGIAGTSIILASGFKMTGNVVGTLSRTNSGILGIILIAIAGALFLKRK